MGSPDAYDNRRLTFFEAELFQRLQRRGQVFFCEAIPNDKFFQPGTRRRTLYRRGTVDRLEGTCKLSQNDPAERREKVVRSLLAAGNYESSQVGSLMTAIKD